MSKKIPTTPRMPWHRKEDRWQVICRTTGRLFSCDSRKMEWTKKDWKISSGSTWNHHGQSDVPWSRARAVIKIIPTPEQVVQAARTAERRRLKAIASLPLRAQAAVKALNADRSAFGCQRKAVIALVGAILGCDLGKVVEL